MLGRTRKNVSLAEYCGMAPNIVARPIVPPQLPIVQSSLHDNSRAVSWPCWEGLSLLSPSGMCDLITTLPLLNPRPTPAVTPRHLVPFFGAWAPAPRLVLAAAPRADMEILQNEGHFEEHRQIEID